MARDILTEVDGQVGVAHISRPAALNALNQGTMDELVAALQHFDNDPRIRCMLLTGDERAFATGADAADQVDASSVEMQQRDPFARWDEIDQLRKPVVAAVNGYALGSGCELVLACDIVVAGETARFGHPEINLGIIPGAGATQRLTRLIGRARAMDLILTGRKILAREALDMGIVSRVVPRENVAEEARKICHDLCQQAPLAVRLAKVAVRKSQDMSLSAGLALERSLCYSLFATDDQKEGMRASMENRPPVFAGR